MSNYLPHTEAEKRAMLKTVGAASPDALFSDIPKSLRAGKLDLPAGKSQQEVQELLEETAAKNKVYPIVLRGAGSYKHYIPPVVKSLAGRSEFLTAYTPYQAEMSQGILQAIFEFQSMIAALTGMDAANASVYNGATAAAEAVLMCQEKGKNRVLVSKAVRPDTLAVIRTYAAGKGMDVQILPCANGKTDHQALAEAVSDGQSACIYCEQPNYYGQIEDIAAIAEIAHKGKAKVITGANPIALALLKSPGECGADIAVGEGQPLGLPMSFGGPYLGFMACKQSELRRLPGRIVGETTDRNGSRAFVLTLQAREQHIRREKAQSNICSNQAHCALTASIYLAAMGAEGLKEAAGACHSLAVYFADRLTRLPNITLKYADGFFHEFVTISKGNSKKIVKALEKKNILAGLPLSEDEILWCVTECVKKEELDGVISVLKEVL